MGHAQREVQVRNRLGMHARAAVKFVQIANRFKSEVKVLKDGQEANGKSIMACSRWWPRTACDDHRPRGDDATRPCRPGRPARQRLRRRIDP
jgi:hypothetical protein